MRFAWLRKNSAEFVPVQQKGTYPFALIKTAYNLVFWIFLLPFIFTAIDYSTGFIAFTAVIFVRLGANLYANNVLKPQQFESFPFRT